MTWQNPLARHIEIQQQQAVEQQQFGSDKPVIVPLNYSYYQSALQTDLARLSALTDIADKVDAKKSMIGVYLPFVKEFCASKQDYQNEVAVWVGIWAFDMGEIETALNIMLALIKKQQKAPEKLKRNLATFVCDQMYDWANALLGKQSASPYLDTVVAAMDNDLWDVPVPVASKCYVILAKHKFKDGDFSNCVSLCDKAIAVNPEGAGVKTLRANAVSALNKS